MAKKPLDPGAVVTNPPASSGDLPLSYVELTHGTKGEVRFTVKVLDSDIEAAAEKARETFDKIRSIYIQPLGGGI